MEKEAAAGDIQWQRHQGHCFRTKWFGWRSEGLPTLREKWLTRRQSQRPQPSCLVLTKAESNEAVDSATEACTRHARRGRGSSLTLGKIWREEHRCEIKG